MTIVCVFGAIYCFFQFIYIELNAHSIMHQIYAAEHGIMGSIFICALFVLIKLNSKTKK